MPRCGAWLSGVRAGDMQLEAPLRSRGHRFLMVARTAGTWPALNRAIILWYQLRGLPGTPCWSQSSRNTAMCSQGANGVMFPIRRALPPSTGWVAYQSPVSWMYETRSIPAVRSEEPAGRRS